jgi:hypothetical protein
MAFNIVEAIQEEDSDCAFDQPCKFGHRVEGHAVYCHNDAWRDGPRKCRRSWYTGGKTKDEDCPGFQPNPEFKGEFNPTSIQEPRCSRCGGSRLIKGDRETVETCTRCMGDGSDPTAMEMSDFAMNTLERCCVHSGKSPAQFDYNCRITENKQEDDDMHWLEERDLISIRSISFTKSRANVYLYKMTAKGDAVMQANWESAQEPVMSSHPPA